jgi:ERG2 and Sigma1 receptor like protein
MAFVFGGSSGVAMLLGRHWVNISDTLVSGEFLQWPEGNLQAFAYEKGNVMKIIACELVYFFYFIRSILG